jgi:multidrug efflux pump subunit AcrA (membrane-fusion protein)
MAVEGNVARLRKIKVGLQGDEYLEVQSGLGEGGTVITVGKERVKDGSAVNPVEAGAQ